MVVVMAPDATDEQIAHVTERVEGVGGQAFVSRGVVRTIIGLVGDIESFHGLNLRSMPGVADVRYDRQWLNRLLAAVGVIRGVGVALAAILTFAAALTVVAIIPVWLAQRFGGDPGSTRV